MTGANTFCFFGKKHTVNGAGDWNDTGLPKLWLYNLHYFDDLNAKNQERRLPEQRALVVRWVAENPPTRGNGWEPYPTSLRIVNWIKWLLRGNELGAPDVGSLAVQTRWLSKRMEYHLLGNHLWANAKALVFAGAYFEGSEADKWRSKGLRVLRREIKEQILDDGGHFELSPMYHATLLEDVLDLVQLDKVYPGLFHAGDVEIWRRTAVNMMRWLKVMTHPDGEISFFNDAAFGIAPSYEDLQRYTEVLELSVDEAPLKPVAPLPDSGYVRLTRGPAVLIADVAKIGPDYLPGHAHADTLSFELSLYGGRVLVNGGTSTYEADNERLRQRGTAAHNTVTVDGEDSSEVWASFRVARRARPSNVAYGQVGDEVYVRGEHDGYKRLKGQVIHAREFRLACDKLEIHDSLSGEYCSAVAMFHLHPSVDVAVQGNKCTIRDASGGSVFMKTSSGHGIRIVNGTWNPEFGKAEPSKVLCVEFDSAALSTTFNWNVFE